VINSTTGVVAASMSTDYYGNYRFPAVPNGNYQMVFTHAHYSDYTTVQPGTIAGGLQYQVNAALSPTLDPGQFRIVMTWTDAAPNAVEDVDSYLKMPDQPVPIFFQNRTTPEANLDVDCTTWKGPETITIVNPVPGVYHYYVVNYNAPDYPTWLGNSKIIVTVYGQTGLVKQYSLDGGSGLVYEFFTIENGVITDVDEYSNSLPYVTRSGRYNF